MDIFNIIILIIFVPFIFILFRGIFLHYRQLYLEDKEYLKKYPKIIYYDLKRIGYQDKKLYVEFEGKDNLYYIQTDEYSLFENFDDEVKKIILNKFDYHIQFDMKCDEKDTHFIGLNAFWRCYLICMKPYILFNVIKKEYNNYTLILHNSKYYYIKSKISGIIIENQEEVNRLKSLEGKYFCDKNHILKASYEIMLLNKIKKYVIDKERYEENKHYNLFLDYKNKFEIDTYSFTNKRDTYYPKEIKKSNEEIDETKGIWVKSKPYHFN